jgi:hypothetical protein
MTGKREKKGEERPPEKQPKLRRYDDLTPEEERLVNHDQQNRTNEDLDADRM